VLCPPFGLEAQAAGRACRALCGQLEVAGFAVLQVDYDGTGDSAGSAGDPARVEAWQRSVLSAIDLLNASGARHVSVVGLRLGATLAASVAHERQIGALVLWDPCDSGRSYLREEVLLRAVYVADQGLDLQAPGGNADDGVVETLGTLYEAETVRAMSELAVEHSQGALASRALVLCRPERPLRRAVLERLSMPHVELADAVGQEELLSVWPLRGLVPQPTLDKIVTWLSGAAGPETSQVAVPSPQSATVSGSGGTAVVEEIRHLGPNRLFGILARPAVRVSDVTAVLLNSGKLDHVGPGRLWVDLARRWAEAGLPVLRVDLSGLGDSVVRPGQEPDVAYSRHALDDISDIATEISPEGPSALVLMGLCSGAYHSVQSGIAAGARGVLAINLVYPSTAAGGVADAAGRSGPGVPAREAAAVDRPREQRVASKALRSLAGWTGTWTRSLVNRFGPRTSEVLKRLARRVLDTKWWVLNRTGAAPRPALDLQRLVERDVDTFVISGSYEASLVTRGDRAAVRRLLRDGRFRMEVFASIDHTLFTKAARDQVLPVLTEHVVSRYAGAGRRGTQPSSPMG
jgi:dienelactone hydrolase